MNQPFGLGVPVLCSALAVVCLGASGGDGPMLKPAQQPAPAPSLGDSYAAFVKAKLLVSELAGALAIERIQRLYVKYGAEAADYPYKAEFNELAAVAADAWPALREKWKALSGSPQRSDVMMERVILLVCWRVTRDERALEILVTTALNDEQLRVLAALTLKDITGVDLDLVSEMTPARWGAYRDRLAAWWKTYRPGWQARMAAREAVESTWAKEREEKP